MELPSGRRQQGGLLNVVCWFDVKTTVQQKAIDMDLLVLEDKSWFVIRFLKQKQAKRVWFKETKFENMINVSTKKQQSGYYDL